MLKYNSQVENIKKENNPINTAEQALLEERKKKHIQEVNEMVAAEMYKKNKKYSQPIYSWRGDDGYRNYSNVGFPKDRNVIDPKIEWQ